MKPRAYISYLQKKSKLILTILIAPLAMTFLAKLILFLIEEDETPSWQLITITSIAVGLYLLLIIISYSGILDKLIISLNKKIRRNRLKRPRVLVFDGTIGEELYETPPIPAMTDHLPDYWENILEQKNPNWKIKTGTLRHFSKQPKYQIVINPFGEIYPEEDTNNYSTFTKICHYVYSGGIFVNVAGIPFWYCHDPRDSRFVNKRITAGFLQKELSDQGNKVVQRSLFKTIFHQLNYLPGDPVIVKCVQTKEDQSKFGEIAIAGGNIKAKIFRAFTPPTPGIIPLLRSENPERWIINSLKYGDGYFILASMDLTGDNNTGSDKIIAAIKGWVNYELCN